MKKLTLNRQKQFVMATIVASFLMFVGNSTAQAQLKYKPGDRVECDTTSTGKWWEKGTVTPFQERDFGGGKPDGSWYRVKLDSNKIEYYCVVEWIRPIAATETNKNEEKKDEKKQESEETKQGEKETLADGDFLECPVEQKAVKTGARPDAELFKKITRCSKGEQPIPEGYKEGAVRVEVSAIQIGTSRPWSYSQDIGNVKPGTLVYPVKASYTVKTFYLNATEVSEGWIRILNFYVNAFGEWQIGSEEPVKAGKTKRIPK